MKTYPKYESKLRDVGQAHLLTPVILEFWEAEAGESHLSPEVESCNEL